MKARVHHVSIVNRYIKPTFEFYHHVLGLKLLMKTVNQDDLTMYHIFFSDNKERIGTELTFFEVPEGEDHQFGTNDIEQVVLKVPTRASLEFWEKRLEAFGVCHYGIETFNGDSILRFEAPDKTKVALRPLREFESLADFYPYPYEEIPLEHSILALDAIQLRVHYPEATGKELVELLGWHSKGQTKFFETDMRVEILENRDQQFYQEVHLIEDRKNPASLLGIGGIQHVAFGVENEEELLEIDQRLNQRNFNNSGIKNREFFKSLYFREPNQLLFEVATVEGYLEPSAYAQQNQNFDEIALYLPNFLEDRREGLEQILAQQKHRP